MREDMIWLQAGISRRDEPLPKFEVEAADGGSAPTIALNAVFPRAKRCAGLNDIRHDLEYVNACLVAIQNSEALDKTGAGPLIGQSLLLAAVATYGRCFNQARGRSAQLEQGKHLKGASETSHKAHGEMMDLRNLYVAHVGQAQAVQPRVVAVLNADPASKKIVELQQFSLRIVVPLPGVIATWLNLISFVRGKVIADWDKAWMALKAELSGYPIDQLYRIAEEQAAAGATPAEGQSNA